MANLKYLKPPEALLRIYSLFILLLDIASLLIGICYAIFVALFRTFKPPSLKKLDREVAMVIGAGRGVGREIAIQLSQFGVSVACVDINAETCKATAQQATLLSGIARSYICNVADKEQVTHTVNVIRSDLGEVTMLLNCCGVPSLRALIQDIPDIRQLMDVSILSHFWLLDSVLPHMKRVGRGHIVALSSVAGLSKGVSRDGRIPLSTAQFAVQGLAESLHTELRHSNSNIIVTLVHIYPFIVGTDVERDIRLRIPSYFGTMPAAEAAKQILDGVRRNYTEFSIPGYVLFLGQILRILPKKAAFMLRDLLDTGVDFG